MRAGLSRWAWAVGDVVCAGQPFCGACRAQPDSRVMTTCAAAAGTETRAAIQTGASGEGVLRGYAIVFGVRSVDLGGFIEVIRPEAVDRTIRESTDLLGLWNHDPGIAIGRVKARTLTVAKDSRGLRVRLAAPSWGADTWKASRVVTSAG
jgi:phage head maturation protease